MHVVECPRCHRTFRAPRAVSGERMRCSRCGHSFVGSSTEAPDAGGEVAPVSPPAAAGPLVRPAARRRPARRSSAGPVMLGVSIAVGLGILVLLIVFIHVRTSRPAAGRYPDRDERAARGRGPEGAEARGQRPRGRHEVPTSHPPRRHSTTRPGRGPGPARPVGDSKLDVSSKVVEGGPIREKRFVVGRVRNGHPHALKRIALTAYVGGVPAAGGTVAFVPAAGSAPYSIEVPREADQHRVDVVATGEPAPAGMVIWEVPFEGGPREANGRWVWTGRIVNTSDVPVRDVRVIVEYFDAAGVQYGTVTNGKLEDRAGLGPGQRGWFRASTDDFNAGLAEKSVVRAIGRRY